VAATLVIYGLNLQHLHGDSKIFLQELNSECVTLSPIAHKGQNPAFSKMWWWWWWWWRWWWWWWCLSIKTCSGCFDIDVDVGSLFQEDSIFESTLSIYVFY